MKNVVYAICVAVAMLFVFSGVGCNTTTTDNSYKLAAEGRTKMTFANFNANKADLKKALLFALADRQWTVTDKSDSVAAYIDHRGQNARAVFTVSDDKIEVETKGSTIKGTPYVPINYLTFLMKSTRKATISLKSAQ